MLIQLKSAFKEIWLQVLSKSRLTHHNLILNRVLLSWEQQVWLMYSSIFFQIQASNLELFMRIQCLTWLAPFFSNGFQFEGFSIFFARCFTFSYWKIGIYHFVFGGSDHFARGSFECSYLNFHWFDSFLYNQCHFIQVSQQQGYC